MDKLKQYTFANKKYVQATELLKLDLKFLQDCANGRRIIENRKLSKKDYVFAKQKNGKWVTTPGRSYKFDKVFISTKWAENMINNDEESEETTEVSEEVPEEVSEEASEEVSEEV